MGQVLNSAQLDQPGTTRTDPMLSANSIGFEEHTSQGHSKLQEAGQRGPLGGVRKLQPAHRSPSSGRSRSRVVSRRGAPITGVKKAPAEEVSQLRRGRARKGLERVSLPTCIREEWDVGISMLWRSPG